MKLSLAIVIGLLCVGIVAPTAIRPAIPADDDQTLLRADRALFGNGIYSGTLDDKLLATDFTWTDASGSTRNKPQITQAFESGEKLWVEAGSGSRDNPPLPTTTRVRTYGRVGIVQENGRIDYLLRVWVKNPEGWQLLIYQAVSIGAPPAAEPGKADCENPCNTVPFQPRTESEREVIHAYQEVERAVAAHNSAAWAAHIADEFFAVTSNSDRPLDKATRMAGLDSQKVAGIAPFPLVSARMFEFGDTMVMISRQQPDHGLPLHVTRVWFKRNGA
jgi:hypothetical protein